MRWLLVVLGSLLAAASPGCGDDEPDLGPFLGVWDYTGSSQARCGSSQPNSRQDMGRFTFTTGAENTLVVVDGNGCTFRLDANGNTATVRPGQTCMQMAGMVPWSVTLTSGSFTLMGLNASYSQAGTVTVGDGLTFTCNYTSNGTAIKAP